MSSLKTSAFTVRATEAQSIRWQRAAQADGHRSTGSWLAAAADCYLKVRARAGLPIPLAWRRGRFSVRLESGEIVPVKGHLSPPFGSFAGTEEGPATYFGRHRHVLVYLPESRIIATLRRFAQCKALASELAPILLRGELPDPGQVVERHVRESV